MGLTLLILTSGFVFYLGTVTACRKDKPQLLQRAGSVIVALQVMAAGVELLRRNRLRKLRERIPPGRSDEPRAGGRNAGLLEREAQRAETQAVLVVLCLALIGELTNGFGDLVAPHLCSMLP